MGEVVQDSARQPLSRRRWLYAAATLAGAGGMALAWWQQHQGDAPGPQSLPDDVWSLNFETPAGPPLATASLRGRPLLINFWATWCPPCIEELPLLDDFYRQNAANGWQVLGLAVDRLEPVRQFLLRQRLTFPVALAGMEGIALSRSLGNSSGGLPFSVVVGSGGAVLDRKIGKASPADLARWQTLK